MIKITQNELDNIVSKHMDWVNGRSGGEKANLEGYDLKGLKLTDVDLRYSNLKDSNLNKTELTGVNFSNANLSNIKINNSNLLECKFHYTNMSRSDFSGSKLKDCQIYFSNLISSKFYKSNFLSTFIKSTELNGTALFSANIKSSNFENSNFQGVDFTKSIIIDTFFTRCDLSFSNMSNVELDNTKLININTNGIDGQNIINVMVNLGEKKINLTYWVDLDIWTQGYMQGNIDSLKEFLGVVCEKDEDIVPVYNDVLDFISNISNKYTTADKNKQILINTLSRLENNTKNNSNDILSWDI